MIWHSGVQALAGAETNGVGVEQYSNYGKNVCTYIDRGVNRGRGNRKGLGMVRVKGQADLIGERGQEERRK